MAFQSSKLPPSAANHGQTKSQQQTTPSLYSPKTHKQQTTASNWGLTSITKGMRRNDTPHNCISHNVSNVLSMATTPLTANENKSVETAEQKITQPLNAKPPKPVALDAKASTKLRPSIAREELLKAEGWWT